MHYIFSLKPYFQSWTLAYTINPCNNFRILFRFGLLTFKVVKYLNQRLALKVATHFKLNNSLCSPILYSTSIKRVYCVMIIDDHSRLLVGDSLFYIDTTYNIIAIKQRPHRQKSFSYRF